MPTYDFLCSSGHRMFETYPIGTAPREVDCPKCHVPMRLVIGAGVQIAPVKGGARVTDTEKARDLDAYARMRANGIQPEHVGGSARLENEVGDTFDVKHRDLYQYASKETIREGVAAAQELGFS